MRLAQPCVKREVMAEREGFEPSMGLPPRGGIGVPPKAPPIREIPKRRVNLPLVKIKVFKLLSQIVLIGRKAKEAVDKNVHCHVWSDHSRSRRERVIGPIRQVCKRPLHAGRERNAPRGIETAEVKPRGAR